MVPVSPNSSWKNVYLELMPLVGKYHLHVLHLGSDSVAQLLEVVLGDQLTELPGKQNC